MSKLIRRASAEARAFGRGKRMEPSSHEEGAFPYAGRAPRFAPVTFSEEYGVRYLHFGTEWVQGAMRLSRPFAIELEYAQQMMAWLLFLAPPERIVQLGLGTAALSKWCYKHLSPAHVEAVELNPAVVVAAHTMFALPDDDTRLTVIECDAWEYVKDPQRRARAQVIQIDLYDATARGPVLDSVAFYRACRDCLREPGMLTVNLFGDHPSFARNMSHLKSAFEQRVLALPEVHEGNRIALAFSGPPLCFAWTDLSTRAAYLQKTFKLPARDWVEKLRSVSPPGDYFEI